MTQVEYNLGKHNKELSLSLQEYLVFIIYKLVFF